MTARRRWERSDPVRILRNEYLTVGFADPVDGLPICVAWSVIQRSSLPTDLPCVAFNTAL